MIGSKVYGPRDRGWIIFVVGTLGFSISNFYRVSLPVISLELAQDLRLTTTQLSHLSASFFYAFALIQIPAGLTMDRFGVRKVLLFLGVLGVPGTLLFALAQTFGQALWGRILMGFGMSCNLMGLLVLLADWFPAYRFATLMGLAVAIGTAGSLLAATPLVILNRALSWRGSFLLLAFINLAYVLAFLAVIRDRSSEPVKSRPIKGRSLKDLIRVFTFPAYWVISLASFFGYGCLTALQGLWAGLYLVKAWFSTLQTGNALFMMGVGYMTGLPLFGKFSDRLVHSRKWVIQPSLLVMACCFSSCWFGPKGFADRGPLSGFFYPWSFGRAWADHVSPYQGTDAPGGHGNRHHRDQSLHHAGIGHDHAGHGPDGGVRAAGPKQPGRVCSGLGPLRRRPGVVGVPLSSGAGQPDGEGAFSGMILKSEIRNEMKQAHF